MSYCVNCGVKLGASEKYCPLCDTEVLNPKEPFDPAAERPYPIHADAIDVLARRRFWAILISMFLALPALTCLFSNLLFNRELSWSFYPVGAFALCWVFIVPQLLFKKPRPVLCAMLDVLSVSAYVYLIEYATHAGGWFWPLAMPIIGLVVVQGVAIAALIVKKIIHGLSVAGAVMLAVGTGALGIEIFISLYSTGAVHLLWSVFVLLPFVSLSVPFFILEHKEHIKAELKRRLHI